MRPFHESDEQNERDDAECAESHHFPPAPTSATADRTPMRTRNRTQPFIKAPTMIAPYAQAIKIQNRTKSQSMFFTF